ncbi:MAG: uridine kinase [Paludibacteraceae bacterium]|jgi:uridine kinase|nr:uridine kinase [Paludibacteraceae bacterium]MBP8627647.1 uridine kinase [Paludibacteraceae bacterium]MBP9647796.1 uridine kinase [Paludibacteraceae bacterium]MBP9970066.1 uridine kinase [Paludibacteraceae bacterium]HNZ84703.1 uridine kinase [Paludibacteraceae bacterium]
MIIIGIAGGTGSGKSTVAKEILSQLPDGDIAFLPQDSYYKDSSHLPMDKRIEINFDHPDSIEFDLLISHIKELKKGNSVQQPIYSYITCSRAEETVLIKPAKIIVVEGILIFTDKELRKLMDLKVFVDADADDRLIRVINRDIVERGRSVNSVIERYQKVLKPMHLQFIEPTKRYADLIIPEGGHNKVAISILQHYIDNKLR